MVRKGGLEPPRLAALEPKSRASTNSATFASGRHCCRPAGKKNAGGAPSAACDRADATGIRGIGQPGTPARSGHACHQAEKRAPAGAGALVWWCSSPVEETSLPHGHCHRGRDSTLVVHPRENGPPPRICSLPQTMNGRRFDPQTRNRTGQSLQSIPNATPAAVLLQMVAFGQVAEVLLQGVPADPGQLDRIHHRDAPVLTGELHDLQ